MSSKLLRLAEVKVRTGLCKTTIYKLMGQGSFPMKRKINGTGSSAWLDDEIERWIEQHRDTRQQS